MTLTVGSILKGRGVTLTVGETDLVLKYAVWAHGFKGSKSIPYKSITSVQFRAAGGMLIGFIQFGILGGIENTAGMASAVFDENSVPFEKSENAAFEELRLWLQSRSAAAEPGTPSVAGEIAQLAALRDQGILTEQEFTDRKTLMLKK